jgi:hypothetical protein
MKCATSRPSPILHRPTLTNKNMPTPYYLVLILATLITVASLIWPHRAILPVAVLLVCVALFMR